MLKTPNLPTHKIRERKDSKGFYNCKDLKKQKTRFKTVDLEIHEENMIGQAIMTQSKATMKENNFVREANKHESANQTPRKLTDHDGVLKETAG